jgi:hypothetical protein
MASSHSIPEWDEATWALFDDALKRFEAAWKTAPEPVLADFVPVPRDDPRYGWMLIRLIEVDCELREQRGECKSLEEYLKEFPVLREAPEALAALGQVETTEDFNHVSDRRPKGRSRDPEVTESGPSQALERDTADIEALDAWQPGEVILGRYEVKELLGEGGMGRVYRVRHREWDIDLAVKCPKPRYFQSQEHRSLFVRECETWVNLGMHPHTTRLRKWSSQPWARFWQNWGTPSCPICT